MVRCKLMSKLAHSINKADIKVGMKRNFSFHTSHAFPTLTQIWVSSAQPAVYLFLISPFNKTTFSTARKLFFLLLLQQQQVSGQAKWGFYLFKAPPIMSTGSASLTSKPTPEIYLSKQSLPPNHGRTMLLEKMGTELNDQNVNSEYVAKWTLDTELTKRGGGGGGEPLGLSSSFHKSSLCDLGHTPSTHMKSMDNRSSVYLI